MVRIADSQSAGRGSIPLRGTNSKISQEVEMKIRLGFVSNSSSCSFYCKSCGETHDVEARGGGPETPEEWMEQFGMEQPTAGICMPCEANGIMACNVCLEPFENRILSGFFSE